MRLLVTNLVLNRENDPKPKALMKMAYLRSMLNMGIAHSISKTVVKRQLESTGPTLKYWTNYSL